jgi:ribonuclease BN (tRNA processing enzyme)
MTASPTYFSTVPPYSVSVVRATSKKAPSFRRSSSGSRLEASSVEPTMSAKTSVAIFRSGPLPGSSGAPQVEQKRPAPVTSAPQLLQVPTMARLYSREVRLTVLGKSPAWQDAGGACSGYLIQEDGTSLLLDCGNGIFGKLRQRLDYTELDAALISHLHADHFLDLVPYAYALTYAPRQQPVPVPPWPGTDSPARPRLVAPPGAKEAFRTVAGAWGQGNLIEAAFALEEYDPASTIEVGPLSATFREVPHFVTTYAVDIRSSRGGRLTFSADCKPNEALVEIGRDTDLLLVEATLPRPERTGVRGHLTPGEAGEHARLAGAKRVVLTHISDELDQTWARKEAAAAYGGAVDVAVDGAVYEV